MPFDSDPGLTVRVLVADVQPLNAWEELGPGAAVEVTHGMFRGLRGYVYQVEELGNLVIREGTPEDWEGR